MSAGPTDDLRQITIKGDPTPYYCRPEQKLLLALESTGQKSIRVGCRQGGCGACRIKVLSGQYRTEKMSVAHVTEEERKQGFALCCRLLPVSDLVVEPAFVGPRRAGNKTDN